MKRVILHFFKSIKEYISSSDKLLTLLVAVVVVMSMFAINSSSMNLASHNRCMQVQALAIVAGVIMMFLISKLNYDILSNLSRLIVIGSFAVLLLTAIFAETVNGNKNWITLGAINIQPSELTKICFAVTMTAHIAKTGENLNKPRNILMIIIHFMFYLVPIVLQGDIGTALVYVGMFAVLMFVSGIWYRYIIVASVLMCGAVPLVWSLLKTYHKQRILFGFQPELDPLGSGYQPLISRMAIGSGQFAGLGYGNGIQSQNSLLPAMHTDFIFANVGEEWGFVGCVTVLAMIAAIVVIIAVNGIRAKDRQGYLICMTVAAMIAVQTIINVGMCIGVLPVIGVTLPFFSYGGSSILSMLMAIGLIQSVRIKPEQALRFRLTDTRIKPRKIKL